MKKKINVNFSVISDSNEMNYLTKHETLITGINNLRDDVDRSWESKRSSRKIASYE